MRLVYDHRVLGGGVARVLAALEVELNGPVLAELHGMARQPHARTAA